MTDGAALWGLTAQLEAYGTGRDSQLGAGDVLLLHKDCLLHSDTLVDEAGVLRDRPLGSNLQSTRRHQRCQGKIGAFTGEFYRLKNEPSFKAKLKPQVNGDSGNARGASQ